MNDSKGATHLSDIGNEKKCEANCLHEMRVQLQLSKIIINTHGKSNNFFWLGFFFINFGLNRHWT